jgi:hypothetical protein
LVKKPILFLALLFGTVAAAQTSHSPANPTGGDLNASSANCTVARSCVWQTLPTNAGTTIILAGTWTATVLVEEANDGGFNFTTAATLSSNGSYSYTTNGYTDIRVRVSAFTSGVVQVSLNTGMQLVQTTTATLLSGGVNIQTSNYSAAAGDIGKLIVMNGASLTLTLPNPPPSSSWTVSVLNHPSSTGSLTVSRNSLNINGQASNLTVPVTGGATIYTDGLNYYTSSTLAGILNGLTALSANLITGRTKISDQGSCTMAAGTCTAQSLASTYAAAPVCAATWTGTGTLTGILKVASTTTTITPSSSVGTDTAQVSWICFGN